MTHAISIIRGWGATIRPKPQGLGLEGSRVGGKYLDARLELIIAGDLSGPCGEAILCALQKLGLFKV